MRGSACKEVPATGFSCHQSPDSITLMPALIYILLPHDVADQVLQGAKQLRRAHGLCCGFVSASIGICTAELSYMDADRCAEARCCFVLAPIELKDRGIGD